MLNKGDHLKHKISLILGFANGMPGVSFYIMLYPQHLMEKLALIPFIILFFQEYIIGGEMDHVNYTEWQFNDLSIRLPPHPRKAFAPDIARTLASGCKT